MTKNFRLAGIVSLVLFLAIFVSFWGSSSLAIAQTGSSPFGPTVQNCFSAHYHAATDCDRLASGVAVIQDTAPVLAGLPVTGVKLFGPTSADCYSTKFHAASDCDRLASGQ